MHGVCGRDFHSDSILSIMKTILLFLLMVSAGSAEAGFLYKGQCYSDTSSALVAWRSSFPSCCSGSPAMIARESLSVASTISSGGLISATLDAKAVTVATWTLGTVSSYQLIACDETMVNTGNIQLMVATLSCVFLFVLGFRSGGKMSNRFGGVA